MPHHAQDAEDVFQATFLLLARKARTIRKRASVGSWLHGVAYRLAVQTKVREARRQARERQATAMRRTTPGVDAAWQELQTLLDEELQRLPEKDRLPLVLCYLEGQTQEEVARQLGWPIGTVRSRLARARDRLRKRLTCRGLTLAAGPFTVVLAANTAGAALPAVLARTTLAAALRIVAGQAIAGTVSAHVVTLLDAASKSLSAMKLKTAAILVAGLCVLGAGAGVVGHQSTPAQPRAAAPPPAVDSRAQPEAVERARIDADREQLPEHSLVRLGSLRHFRPGMTVNHAAFSPDGKMLALASRRAVTLWDLASGKERAVTTL